MLKGRKGSTQARGRIRRRQLLDAAKLLLAEHEIDAISLGDIAQHAGISKGAAYHLFGSLQELYSELVREFCEKIVEDFAAPVAAEMASWQEIADHCFQRGVDYYGANPAAQRLIIGTKTPPDIKRSDRANDLRLGGALEAHIAEVFVLPPFPDSARVFFCAIEILDLFFCLSVMEDGRITPTMAREAKRAAIAYLGLYIPAILPRREGELEQAMERLHVN